MSMEERFLRAWRANRAQAEALGVRLRPLTGDELACAHRALSGSRESDGFAQLAACARTDLTLEALAASSAYTALFSDAEVNAALDRLLRAGHRFR